ncbi:MAG: hypothetical protein ACR2LK_08945 [Solirubrobacteraceae bacterium]
MLVHGRVRDATTPPLADLQRAAWEAGPLGAAALDAAATEPASSGRRPATDDRLGTLLRCCVQQRAAADGQLLQRAKSGEQRSTKHRSIHKALRTIGLLGKNIKAGLDRHVFDALPVSKALDKADPTGLHAYRGGRLPAGVTGVVTGNPNKVHTLTWHWGGKAQTKQSTMFPTWMPEDHVRTLIALDYVGERANAVPATDIDSSAARTYITRGARISLSKAGDTVYPEL